ncbi:MAG TPA: heme peroxidase family protein, partial [Chitinophagaceae bacterium]|nr:heme peroxidase family protein [Chitinophagaceae bacterium]
MSHHGAYYQDVIPYSSRYYDKGKFGRLFPNLPPFATDTKKLREALMEIGEKGGIMDANDDLTLPPSDHITSLPAQVHNPNSPVMTAGMTFLGQFIDHDMSFDPTSSLERQVDPELVQNFRTPSLGLDNVYGSGHLASPHLFDTGDGFGGIKFLLEPLNVQGKDGVHKFDLPRNKCNTALIGDPRNDENLIVSQLHLLFLRFHNALVDQLHTAKPSKSPMQLYKEAQELVRWHYQWIVLHEFLPMLCGEAVVNDILTNGRKFYGWNNEPFIPVEFSVAAYRFGHSQIRPSYRANFGIGGSTPLTPFFGYIFNSSLDPSIVDPEDFRGGCRAARRFIDWHTFFNLGDGNTRANKLIDTKLSSPLFQLMGMPGGEPISLAQRNLLRQLTFKLPSGQRVAHAMRMEHLEADALDELKKHKLNLETSTPLWYYILKEAEVEEMGLRLG